jgi:prephenate dehydrogenase
MKIAIFGVGLIGGSLALCFKGKPDIEVFGHSNNPKSVEKYLQREVVDKATTSMEVAALNADFIFLCVPVGNLEDYLARLMKLPLKQGCIITDVGSTKSSIAKFAKGVSRDGVYFIGGHPMAGSERSGVEAANENLFENAIYVLTPEAITPLPVYQRLSDLLSLTRAQIIRMDADQHDEIVGAISHLPHIIAAALVNQVSMYNDANDLHERLAAGGFRDITRIASCDPVIWRDILINNREVLLNQLKDWNLRISEFIEQLKNEDGPGIEEQFRRANSFRSRLPERKKGVITSINDVYVDVPDHPGIIGQIASQLGVRHINLRNIQIIESREEVPGVLRLSFRNEHDLDRAVVLLQELSYTIHF